MSAVAARPIEPRTGWRVVALSDVAQVVNGGTPKSKVVRYWGGDVQWLTPKDMGQMDVREIAATPRRISAEGLANSSARIVPRNSVILSTRAPIGHLAVNTVPMAFNQGCRGIVPSTDLDTTFLYYFLLANKQQLDDLGSGTTFKELSASNLKSVQLPLPSLEEQKRIVAVLDQAFAALDRARTNAEANLADAQELFASELDLTLARKNSGWKPRPLRLLGAIQTGSTPRTSEPGNFGSDIPFITPADFRSDGSLDTGNRGLSTQGATKARLIPKGSALMVCIGATIGKAGFATAEVVANQQINSISPNDGVSGEYLYYQFISPHFQRELMSRAGQATLPIVSKRKWSEIPVVIPPDLDTQREVVAMMRDIRANTERLQQSYRAKLADIAALRQSLLQKAFAGELA